MLPLQNKCVEGSMIGQCDKFTLDKFDKSALAMHIFTDHPNNVGTTTTQLQHCDFGMC